MKILVVASESAPYAKTGGLGETVGAFFDELCRLGADARLVIPLYRGIRQSFKLKATGRKFTVTLGGSAYEFAVLSHGKRVWFMDCPELFDREYLYGPPHAEYSDNARRFALMGMAALELTGAMRFAPDIIHCHDWQSGLVPMYLKTTHRERFASTRTLLTVHNLGYQGLFPSTAMSLTGLPESLYNPEALEFYGQVNYLKAGIVAADEVNTVSERYAAEILTPGFGFGLDGVLRARGRKPVGILNGIDVRSWDPATDGHLPARYAKGEMAGKAVCKARLARACAFKKPDAPLIGMVSRLVRQKGLDWIVERTDEIVGLGANIVILGQGESEIEAGVSEIQDRHRGAVLYHSSYDEDMARLIYAGSDMALVPSRYEPCGLAQMFAMRYGTLPVVTRTGGLADTVEDHVAGAGVGTGFVFEPEGGGAFIECVKRALCAFRDKAEWDGIVERAMARDFSWKRSAERYLELYGELYGRALSGGMAA